MTAAVVVDASAVVALLVDEGVAGRWIRGRVSDTQMHAPHLMPYEVQNVLRRLERSGVVSRDNATLACGDLSDMPVGLWPPEATGARTWELRHNLSAYDTAYVALAELLECPLLTADRAIGSAAGKSCHVEILPMD